MAHVFEIAKVNCAPSSTVREIFCKQAKVHQSRPKYRGRGPLPESSNPIPIARLVFEIRTAEVATPRESDVDVSKVSKSEKRAWHAPTTVRISHFIHLRRAAKISESRPKFTKVDQRTGGVAPHSNLQTRPRSVEPSLSYSLSKLERIAFRFHSTRKKSKSENMWAWPAEHCRSPPRNAE